MNAERLEKLAAFLDTLPAPLFNFARWLGDGELPPAEALAKGGGCGTTACAIGWAPAVFPEHWQWFKRKGETGRLVGLKPEHRGWWLDPVRDAEHFFGLVPGDTDYLFTPHDHDEGGCTWDDTGCLLPDEDATAKDVAAHIRRFIKAGGDY